MPQVQENYIKFGYVTKDDMYSLIAQSKVSQYDIVFTKDTKEQFIISSTLEPVAIKSRVRIYNSVSDAITDINDTEQTYAGELVSIRNGENFNAYIVNRNEDSWTVNPVHTESQVDYDSLTNIPIKQLKGTVQTPILLTSLQDGHYKISGVFKTPDNREISSIIGNYVIVENNTIKRINSNSITDYVINGENVVVNSYANEEFIREQGYATESYVNTQLDAFKITMEQYIREYIESTVSLLIKYLIDEELDSRYATKQDIDDLFTND